jgi:hypothetical protein
MQTSSPEQYAPGAQIASPPAHPMWQRGTSSRQVKGAQLSGAGTRHFPAPLQVLAGVSWLPAHLGAAQIVPSAYFPQLPKPSQRPFAPHVAGP